MNKPIHKNFAILLLLFIPAISGYNADAQSWQPVGTAFPQSPGFSISLATNKDTVYMSYADSLNRYKATVVKYVDSSWVTVGNAGFTPGEANRIYLVMDSSGT